MMQEHDQEAARRRRELAKAARRFLAQYDAGERPDATPEMVELARELDRNGPLGENMLAVMDELNNYLDVVEGAEPHRRTEVMEEVREERREVERRFRAVEADFDRAADRLVELMAGHTPA